MSAFQIETYREFSYLLEKRIATNKHLTEDSVRYSFFIAMLQTTDIEQHEIVLELPHPEFEGKEIDTYIQTSDERPEMYIEFKFHRTSKSTSPKPQKAGSLFKDFNRLASIKAANAKRLVIYLTDSEMAKYYEKNSNPYSNFWHRTTGESFILDESFIKSTTDTFRKASGDLHPTKVSVTFSGQLARDYQLRVFEVSEI